MPPLDKQRCERAAGRRFSDEVFARLQWFAEYCELYADPGAEGLRAPLHMMPDFRANTTANQQQALHELVAGVQQVWRDSGGAGSGDWYDMNNAKRNGKLVRLLTSMFKQARVRVPSARTLRRALEAVRNP